MNKILTLICLFISIKKFFSTSTEEIIQSTSKYKNVRYINCYKIPTSLMTLYSNGYEYYSNKLLYAFDGDFDTFWRSSGIQGSKFTNPEKKKEYEPLINSIIITFSQTIKTDRMLYKAPFYNGKEGRGYPVKLSIYYKIKDINGNLSDDDNDFLLFDEIISEQTGNLVLFTFEEIIECDQIKIEWKEFEDQDAGYASASEIILLFPENESLDKLIFDVFKTDDFYNLKLNKEYSDIEIIDNLLEELKDLYNYSDYLKNVFKRIKSIINGEIIYESKREFTTNQDGKKNIIYQRGNILSYSKQILKMDYGGTDRQCTGIYAFPNDTIKIYVECEDNDILPSIRFSQFLGSYNSWLGSPVKLNNGVNNLIVPKFNMNNYVYQTNPGGPIYIENKFTSEEQSQKIKIYIEGGVLFPLFRKNDNEDEFKTFLNNYILEYNKNIDTYLNITELYSDHIMITVSATDAYELYINQNKSPQANLLKWDERIDNFLKFDGIPIVENYQYYDIKTKYINIHLRYSQRFSTSALAYATNEHIGIYMKNHLNHLIDSTEGIENTIAHEIGHIMDVSYRIISEQTNNVITQFSKFLDNGPFVTGDFRIAGEAMYQDNVDIFLRGCRVSNTSQCNGLFYNYYNYKLGYVFWWFIEMIHIGYWGELDNLYRYNISLIDGMSKTEGMIYLTNYIVNLDMGYYFERLGFAFEREKIFSVQNASELYKQKMEELLKERNIDTSIKKKIWYFDEKQYYFMLNNGKGCYYNKDSYDIQIVNVTSFLYNKRYINYNITLPDIDCEGHLGFEIYENEKFISFTHRNYYVDSNKYEENYIPKYKIIAFDRLLYQSNPSEYKVAINNLDKQLIKSKILYYLKFKN